MLQRPALGAGVVIVPVFDGIDYTRVVLFHAVPWKRNSMEDGFAGRPKRAPATMNDSGVSGRRSR
jgi:hypothetical protein